MHGSKPGFEKARELALKKEEEERLVRKLLSGDLTHRQDPGDTARFIKEALGRHDNKITPASDAPASPSQLTRILGRAAVDKPSSVALHEAVEMEKARRKILDGIVLAMDSKKRVKERPPRSDADKEKEDEEYYFRYEKLHELRDELAAARREISHEKYSANAPLVAQLINQKSTPQDDMQLGDVDTYNSVEKMLKELLIRRHHATDEDMESADSPAYMHLLKHKLFDAREQIQDLRRKLSELNDALKIASLESKSALALLAERNDDVEKQRNTISVLQMQLKNFRSRSMSSNLNGASAGLQTGDGAAITRDDLISDLEQLRQQYQDLAQVNLVLEKQIKMMRIRNAFARVGQGETSQQNQPQPPSGVPRRSSNLRSFGSDSKNRAQSRAQSAASSSVEDEIPTTKLLMGVLDARRRHDHRLAKTESSAMAAWDYDAGSAHRIDPFAAREAARRLNVGVLGGYDATTRHGSARQESRAGSGPRAREAFITSEAPRNQDPSSVNGVEALAKGTLPQSPKMEKGSPVPQTPRPLRDATPVATPVSAPLALAPPSKTSRAWILLRQRVVNFVGISRADVLRREEAHIKKQRKEISLLSSELAAVAAERDNFAERMSRLAADLALAKESAVAEAIRADRAMRSIAHEDAVPVTSAPSSAVGTSRAQTADDDKWTSRSEEGIARIRAQIRQHDTAQGEDSTFDAQIENIVAIFQSKIQTLQSEIAQRDRQISDFHTGGATPAKADMPLEAQSVAPDATDATVARLEREVLRKDRQLLEQAQEVRMRDLQLKVATDMAAELKAQQKLGLSDRSAARVVHKIRDWVSKVRDRMIADGRFLLNPPTGSSRNSMSERGDDSFLRSAEQRAIRDEELREEERSLLNQMLSLSTNPTVVDHVTQQINQLRIDDASLPVGGGSAAASAAGDRMSRLDRQWGHMRRLWLRLLTVREQAWQEAADPQQRKYLEEKVVESYAAFLKFEQLDRSDGRPSFACEGAMRTITFASAPLTKEIVGEQEVHREYTALKELVKTRASQQLQLEAQRDETYDKLQRRTSAAVSTSTVAPHSALYILHTVRESETSAVIAAMYGITNLHLIRQTFGSVPRNSTSPSSSEAVYIPIRSVSALNSVTSDDDKHHHTLIVRHVVCPHDTVNSIANQYSVSPTSICKCGSLAPLNVGDTAAVVDVIVPRRIALPLVQLPDPVNPVVQTPYTVLARFEKPLLPVVASRAFNVSLGDVHLFNEPLQCGVTVRIPLIFNVSLISMMPQLLRQGQVAVMHERIPGETLADIAEKYGTSPEMLKAGESVTGATAVMVPLTDVDSLGGFVYDRSTLNTLRLVSHTHDQDHPVDQSFDTPLTKLMWPQVQGVTATSTVQPDELARVRSVRVAKERPQVTGLFSASALGDLALEPPEVRLFEHKIVVSERLEMVSRRYGILREDITVPNFALLDHATSTWCVRLNSTRNIQKAREIGATVHCIVNLVNETLRSLADSVGTTVDAIRMVNTEQELGSDFGVSEPLTGRIRVPLSTPRIEYLAMKRTGEFYATVTAVNLSPAAVAAELLCDVADVQAFDATLLPGVTPVVKIDVTAAYACEHRLVVTFSVAPFKLGELDAEDLSRLRSKLERDVMEMIAYAKTAQTPGEIEHVQIAMINEDENAATAVITCSSQELLDKVEKIMRDDGPISSLESTLEFAQERLKCADLKLPLNPRDIKRYHFRAAWSDCHVAVVKPDDTLVSVALRTKVGIDDLLVFNPNLMNVIYRHSSDFDEEPGSLGGIAEARVPGSRDLHCPVEKDDAIVSLAARLGTTVRALKAANVERLPLFALIDSIRVPRRSADFSDGVIITIRTHGALSESLLALATRHGVQVDDLRVPQIEIALGTVLRIPSACGMVMRGGRFYVVHPELEHRCEFGETLETIAQQYGILVDEIKYSNASRLCIAPRSCVGLRITSSTSAVKGEAPRYALVKHPVREGETAPSIAARYFQAITSLLAHNPRLYEIPGAHRILVPVVASEADDVLSSQSNNIYTIVSPGPYDTVPSIARRFMIDQEHLTEVNKLVAENLQGIIVPIASPMAAATARQKQLPLYVGIEIHRGETLVNVADRYGVGVKDLIVLGQPLLSLGIDVVEVPVSIDVAEEVLKSIEHATRPSEQPRVAYCTVLGTTERLQSLASNLGLSDEQQQQLVVSPAGHVEVPLTSLTTLELVRRREAEVLQQRNELAQQVLGINQALRQLKERNEATKRELLKVEQLRAKFGSEYVNHGPRFNMESVGCQTDQADELFMTHVIEKNDEPSSPLTETASAPNSTPQQSPGLRSNPGTGSLVQARAPRRNGASQTKLMSHQLVSLEETAAGAATKYQLLEAGLADAKKERDAAHARVAELEETTGTLQHKIAKLSEELRAKIASAVKTEQLLRNQIAEAEAAAKLNNTNHPQTMQSMIKEHTTGRSHDPEAVSSAGTNPTQLSPLMIDNATTPMTLTLSPSTKTPVNANIKIDTLDEQTQTSDINDPPTVTVGRLSVSLPSFSSEQPPVTSSSAGGETLQAGTPRPGESGGSTPPPRKASSSVSADTALPTTAVARTVQTDDIPPIANDNVTEVLVDHYEEELQQQRQRSLRLWHSSMRTVREDVVSLKSELIDLMRGFGLLIHSFTNELASPSSTANTGDRPERSIAALVNSSGSVAVPRPVQVARAAVQRSVPQPPPASDDRMKGRPQPKVDNGAQESEGVIQPRDVTSDRTPTEANHLISTILSSAMAASSEDPSPVDWMKQRLSSQVLSNIAVASHSRPIAAAAPENGSTKSTEGALPPLRASTPREDSRPTLMRENIVQKVLGPNPPPDAHRPYSSDSIAKPEMKTTLPRQEDEAAPVHSFASPSHSQSRPQRRPAPPDRSKYMGPHLDRAAREYAEHTPLAFSVPKTLHAPSRTVEEDLSKLVTYAAQQSDRMKRWQDNPTLQPDPALETGAGTSVPPHLEDLVPVVALIERLDTHGEAMSAEQQTAVVEARKKDKQLRREAAALGFRTMQTKLELARVEKRIFDLADGKERDGLAKIAEMWRRWLKKWNHRRQSIVSEQQSNLHKLIAMFVVSQDEYTELVKQRESAKTVHSATVGRAPSLLSASRPLAAKGGLLVVRPHRPGSKWLPMQPPEQYPNTASSKHLRPSFAAVN